MQKLKSIIIFITIMAERARCDICNQEFKDNDGLSQHQKAKHGVHMPNSSSNKSSPQLIQSGKKTYLIIIGIFVVIALFWYFKSQPNGNVVINMTDVIGSGRPVNGNSNAPVTIVEFSDFQCPYCVVFSKETYPLIKRDYISTGKVKMIFRNFPIYQAHPQAMQAAEAALCVHKEGGDESFFKYHDKLFQNYESLPEEKLILWASEMGYNITSCLQSKTLRNDVLKDLEDGAKSGVQGTPSFFINGKMIAGNLPYTEFKKVIDSSLR